MASCTKDVKDFISRISGYEKASAIIWLILGIIQLLIGITVGFFLLIGIWNIVASISRFKLVDRIRALDPDVPNEYEGIFELIIFGIINLLLGAILGIAGIILDFYIRDQILKNRHVFDSNPLFDSNPQNAAMPEKSYQLLVRLGELRNQKIITEEEFLREKQKLFNDSTRGSTAKDL